METGFSEKKIEGKFGSRTVQKGEIKENEVKKKRDY